MPLLPSDMSPLSLFHSLIPVSLYCFTVSTEPNNQAFSFHTSRDSSFNMKHNNVLKSALGNLSPLFSENFYHIP